MGCGLHAPPGGEQRLRQLPQPGTRDGQVGLCAGAHLGVGAGYAEEALEGGGGALVVSFALLALGPLAERLADLRECGLAHVAHVALVQRRVVIGQLQRHHQLWDGVVRLAAAREALAEREAGLNVPRVRREDGAALRLLTSDVASLAERHC